MKLNIKARIFLNGILSVVISIMLVTIIVSLFLWDRSEKQARQQIRHALRVIELQVREVADDLREIAVKIGDQQEYANRLRFIQDNENNQALVHMMDGERRELTVSLYEVAMTSGIPLLVLHDINGNWMCAVKLKAHQARLIYRGALLAQEAMVPLGGSPRTEQWHETSDTRHLLFERAHPPLLPSGPVTSMTVRENRLSLTVSSPLQAQVLDPETLREKRVQNGLIQISRPLDESFVGNVCDLTGTEINLFIGTTLSVGSLASYPSLHLDKQETEQLGTNGLHPPEHLAPGLIHSDQTVYRTLRMAEGAFFEGIVPIFTEDHALGAFSVLLSQEETRTAQWRMIRSLFIVAMICILIITPLTWFLAIKEIIERERMQKELARHRDHLEELVEERTAALAMANDQLDQKNMRLNETLEEVEEVNKEITESIQYARTIQRSLLTNPAQVKTYLPDSFFIWMPCEIVSGDIIHADQFEDGVMLSVIDCTGHGVPGGFMTMLAFSAMRRITRTEKCHDPAEILRRLNHTIKTTLHQNSEYARSDDGMDVAICFVKTSQESGVRGEERGVRGEESGVRGEERGVRGQESGVSGQGENGQQTTGNKHPSTHLCRSQHAADLHSS